MARARSIKPGFYRDSELVELPIETRLLFPGLWMLADREGRLEDKPKQIKMEIYPADNFDVDDLLGQLQRSRFIVRYIANGLKYIQICGFSKHQNPHRDEKASTIPAPSEHDINTVQALCEHGANRAGTLTPDSLNLDSKPLRAISKPKGITKSIGFAHFWELWPSSGRKVAKAKCEEHWLKRNLDSIADQIIAHVQAMKGSKQWQDGFDPAPLTYLHQRRWEDGIGAESKAYDPMRGVI